MVTIESLEQCLLHDPMCVGVAWECRKGSGLYNYQTDNDLGLEPEEVEGVLIKAERVPIGNGHYMLVDLSDCEDAEDSGATDLDTVKALLKECHPTLFTLDPSEATLCQRYAQQF